MEECSQFLHFIIQIHFEWNLCKILISSSFLKFFKALPGLVLYGPLGLVIKYLSEKERKKVIFVILVF